MKIKFYLVFLMLAIIAIALMGAAATMSLRASGIGFNPDIKKLEAGDIEEDLCLDPTYGADNGFVVNPYQGVNPDQNQALIIGASVSYILKEVKAFTMFAISLAVLALTAFVLIAYIVMNRIASPAAKAKEPAKNEELGIRNEEYVNGGKEPNFSIECLSSNTAFLTRNIDEMLTEIEALMEKTKVKWSIML